MKFSVVQQNINATDADLKNRQRMARYPQLCWKCQQDKTLKGGSIKMFGSVRRFICKDCVEAKQAEIASKKEQQA